ncbi:hypothetical protein [Staphylococcus equorum]|uniref:Uncharacterized protein n=1 Tax=Staphylococcus equorum TaxID=246432 RepID=A0AAW7AIJ2_9STAP|nr:hypothetical protein [Staphylococcus equorum]MDK9865956.1 hypothetical protein [Staphylococcus equorum]
MEVLQTIKKALFIYIAATILEKVLNKNKSKTGIHTDFNQPTGKRITFS